MSMRHWTPAPWTVHSFVDHADAALGRVKPTDYGLYEVEEAHAEVRSAIEDEKYLDAEQIAAANARLIAAAPALFEALATLTKAVETFRHGPVWCEAEMAPAREALRLATEGPQS